MFGQSTTTQATNEGDPMTDDGASAEDAKHADKGAFGGDHDDTQREIYKSLTDALTKGSKSAASFEESENMRCQRAERQRGDVYIVFSPTGEDKRTRGAK